MRLTDHQAAAVGPALMAYAALAGLLGVPAGLYLLLAL